MEPLSAEDPPHLGGYRLLARLGAGGMGRVYLGRTSTRPIAVKMIHGHLAAEPGFRERFAREVALAERVRGSYTAAVLDADPLAEAPWLATEYVAAPTVYQAITVAGPLPQAALRVLAAGLAEALVAIHRAGIVHRDLKPGNVLLARDGPRVIDFGIAKALHEGSGTTLTPTDGILGTPGYMSPEQVEGRELTASSDVFALGGVLYFAATGRKPFGPTDPAIFHRILTVDPPLGQVPEPQRELLATCLRKAPQDRPGAREVVELIGELDFGELTDWLPEPVRRLTVQADTDLRGHVGATTEPPVRPYEHDPPPPVTTTGPVTPDPPQPPDPPRAEPAASTADVHSTALGIPETREVEPDHTQAHEQDDAATPVTHGERIVVLTLGAFLVLSCIWVFTLPLLYINGVEVSSAPRSMSHFDGPVSIHGQVTTIWPSGEARSDGTWVSRARYYSPSEEGTHVLLAVLPLLSLSLVILSRGRRLGASSVLRGIPVLGAASLTVLAGVALVTLITLWPGWAPDLLLLSLTGVALCAPVIPLGDLMMGMPQKEAVPPAARAAIRGVGLLCAGLLVWLTWWGTQRLMDVGTSMEGFWLPGIVGLLLLLALGVLHASWPGESGGDEGAPGVAAVATIVTALALPLYGILGILGIFGSATADNVMTVLRWLLVLAVPLMFAFLALGYGVLAPARGADRDSAHRAARAR